MTALNVSGPDALAAWKIGASRIASTGDLFNLFTTIDDPTSADEGWYSDYCPSLQGSRDTLRDVAQTIFPTRLASRSSTRQSLYDGYLRAHDRGRSWQRNRGSWGTYFERLVRFPPDGVNQLDRAIQKLGAWQRTTTAFVFHLSTCTVDQPRRLGGPCWQYGELLWREGGVLDLSVTYRNHDFFNKALGNFVGLGQLLSFICTESGKTPGKLFCHSVHAYSSASMSRLRLLARI